MSERANPTNDPGLVLGDDGVVYEVASDGTRTPLGNGGSSSFLTQTFSLTAAQIKAATATPATVVAAPGANKMIVPISYALAYDFGTVGYDGSGIITALIGSQDIGTVLLSLLSQTEDSVGWTPWAGTPPEQIARAEFVNQPLKFQTLIPGAIVTAHVSIPGSGYAVNDTGTIDDGSTLATYRITSVAGGAVTGFVVVSGGEGYIPNTEWNTTPGGGQPGGGSGFTVIVDGTDSSGAAGDGTLAGEIAYRAVSV